MGRILKRGYSGPADFRGPKKIWSKRGESVNGKRMWKKNGKKEPTGYENCAKKKRGFIKKRWKILTNGGGGNFTWGIEGPGDAGEVNVPEFASGVWWFGTMGKCWKTGGGFWAFIGQIGATQGWGEGRKEVGQKRVWFKHRIAFSIGFFHSTQRLGTEGDKKAKSKK